MKEMEKHKKRYLSMTFKTLLPAYADRVEKLCQPIAEKYDIDQILQDNSEE